MNAIFCFLEDTKKNKDYDLKIPYTPFLKMIVVQGLPFNVIICLLLQFYQC